MPNIQLREKRDLSSFRRIAIGTWRRSYDPSVYGSMRLRMDETLRYMDAFRAQTGRKLTLTHLMAKAVAGVLADIPDANAVLRFNRIYLREDVDIFFQVALEDPETGEVDLSGAVVRQADRKSLLEVVDDFQASVDKVRARTDKELEGTRSTMKSIPLFAIGWLLDLLGFLLYTLNLDLRWAGLPKDPFGSCMVTNVGSLGLEEAYVPLVPYSRVPLLVAVGKVEREALVDEAGQIEIVRTMKVFATFDHRLLDGQHAARMSKTLRAWFEDPWTHFGPIPGEGAATTTPMS
jgi:pyruvate/2-oxoglutarate dehydrogenase complex dihydrolipoamide acyltransferase (E2) component